MLQHIQYRLGPHQKKKNNNLNQKFTGLLVKWDKLNTCIYLLPKVSANGIKEIKWTSTQGKEERREVGHVQGMPTVLWLSRGKVCEQGASHWGRGAGGTRLAPIISHWCWARVPISIPLSTGTGDWQGCQAPGSRRGAGLRAPGRGLSEGDGWDEGWLCLPYAF